jgi:hypothetical protein
MIGRLSLTWLWPILWVIALSNAPARAAHPGERLPTAYVQASASENQASQDLGFHFRSARSARRFDSEMASDDSTPAICHFQVEVVRGENAFCFSADSGAGVGLANSWQFLWRTALSPRAPSFVS